MDVQFANKNSGKFVLPCPELGDRETIAFRKTYATSDKRKIRILLSHPFAARHVELLPGQDFEAINDYLESDEQPDVMTREFLDSIEFEAWRLIIDVLDLDVKFPLVGIAKAKLEGKPMDPNVERIAKEYKKAKTPEQRVREADQDKKVKLKLSKAKAAGKTSGDFLAKEAVEHIETTSKEDLKGFLDEDDDRVTVLRAWEAKFSTEEAEEEPSEESPEESEEETEAEPES